MNKCRSVVIASPNRPDDTALATESCYTDLKNERIPV